MTFISKDVKPERSNDNQFHVYRFEFTAPVERHKTKRSYILALSLTPQLLLFVIRILLLLLYFFSSYIELCFPSFFFLLLILLFMIPSLFFFFIVPLCSGDVAHWLNRSPSHTF